MNSQDDKVVYSKEDVIQEIQAGPHTALTAMYPRYQKAFLRWARSWNKSFDDDVLIEAYMEAIIVFYTNVVTGHLTVLTTSVENYLITIGRNKLMRMYEKRKHTVYTDDFTSLTLPIQEDILSQIIIHEVAEDKN